jgi:hypothetical protein
MAKIASLALDARDRMIGEQIGEHCCSFGEFLRYLLETRGLPMPTHDFSGAMATCKIADDGQWKMLERDLKMALLRHFHSEWKRRKE